MRSRLASGKEGLQTMVRQSVGQWLEATCPNYDTALSPVSREAERELAASFDVNVPDIPYARYGNTISLAVAKNYADRVGATGLGFEARLTNCGMAAIRAVFETGIRCYADHLAAGKVLYGLTDELFRTAPDLFRTTKPHRFNAVRGLGPDVFPTGMRFMVFVETIGNGIPMPVFVLEKFLREHWNNQEVLVVDGTFTTCALLNPFGVYDRVRRDFGPGTIKLVYVESLSKYYRTGDIDHGTAGIIVAPQVFIAECDKVLAHGFGIQYPQLADFPVDLFGACAEVMPRLSFNAKAAAEFLRGHPRVRNVWYPGWDSELARGAGGVLYLEVETDERGAGERLFEPVIPFRASFGHAQSTHVDFGQFNQSLPPGTIRLAVGTRETPSQVVAKLQTALGPRL